MAAPHHGHIICLYAGRAVYCPKMATLQATLKAALECLGLETGREVHFAFPHADLAILVEISTLAFKNVRDGAILYLCDGKIGPVYPHELALQAHQGQAAAAAVRRAITPAPDAAETPNTAAAARGGRINTTNSNSTRATRASRRLRKQTNGTEAGNPNDIADKDLPQEGRLPSANANAEGSNAGSSSSVNGSSSSSSAPTRIKREIIDEEEHDENLAYEARARNGHDGHDDDDDAEDLDIIPGDPYFKRRRVAH